MSKRVGAEPDQVRVDAGQLVEHEADPHGARRNLQSQELFDGQHVGEVVGHGTEIVDAVGHGDDLLVELGLAGLLDAGVQEADVGTDADDGLAVDFQQETKHAVGGRVLRPHVQDHGLVAVDGFHDRRGVEWIDARH